MMGRETRKGLMWRIVALVALLVAGCSNTPPDQATPLPAGTDEDGDGYTVENGDCDDKDAAIHPGADEVCDDIDNDCNGLVDDDAVDAMDVYVSQDGDPYCWSETARVCQLTEGYCVYGYVDCDDSDPEVYPGADEVCGDGIDQDCNGWSDDVPVPYYVDDDGDGSGDPGTGSYVCESDMVPTAGDCDDTDPAVNPMVAEVCGDGIDNNCDGSDLACGLTGDISLTNAYATIKGSDGPDSTYHGDFGWVFSIDGDLNQDGYPDLLVGVPDMGEILYDYPGTGGAILFHGPFSGVVPFSDAAAILLGTVGSETGASVSLAGDLNGDGQDDMVVSAPSWTNFVNAYGMVYLFYRPVSGDLEPDSADVTVSGDFRHGVMFGKEIATGCDVNGDGQDDLLVSAPWDRNWYGAVYVFYGPLLDSRSSADADAILFGDGDDYEVGMSLACDGDVNGDGVDDILVGAPWSAEDRGRAYLVYGPVSGSMSLGAADAILYGTQDLGAAGWAVSMDGDVNGDGFDDVLIGATGDNQNAPATQLGPGRVYLLHGPLHGTIDLMTSDAIFMSTGTAQMAGQSVSLSGDINGDGLHDVLIGVGSDDYYGTDWSATYLFRSPVQGEYLLNSEDADAKFSLGEAKNQGIGWDIHSADMDGDGFDDLVLSGTGVDSYGRVFLFQGGTPAPDN